MLPTSSGRLSGLLRLRSGAEQGVQGLRALRPLGTQREQPLHNSEPPGSDRTSSRSGSGSWLIGLLGAGIGGFALHSLYHRMDESSRSRWFLRRPLQAAQPMKPPGNDGDGGSSFPDEEFDRAKSKVRCREKFNFIADVVSEVAPALVFIQIKDRNTTDYYTNEPMTSSTGSGFIVSSDGLIVTNAHVVLNKPRTQFEVQLQDGRKFPGRVESIDVKSDLATVRIDAKNLPVMPLGKSSDTKPGEFVIAMGSPLSLSNTITTGVVSSVTRQGKELGIKNRDVPIYIQTDASITFGNSGGPLVNLDGEAIGVNSMKITPGISFAIPIDYTKEFLRRSAKELREGKRPKEKGFLGLRYLVLSPQTRAGLEIPSAIPHGIIVNRIVVGSPAHRAGIQPGDIIMDINGTPIKTGNDYNRMLEVDAHEDVEFKVGLVRRTGPNSFQKMKAVLRPVFN